MAHRGGFKPDNSLASFQKCLDIGTIPIIELDVSTLKYNFQVWLTKDEELIVVHGGDSGEINFSHCPDTQFQSKNYIFECTLSENREFEKSFILPTLKDVIKLINKEIFINIEMKVPYDEQARSRYNYHRAV